MSSARAIELLRLVPWMSHHPYNRSYRQAKTFRNLNTARRNEHDDTSTGGVHDMEIVMQREI